MKAGGVGMKAGDVVRLKSGGPAMTVLKFTEYTGPIEPHVQCGWFTDEDEFKSADFLVAALKPAGDDEWRDGLPKRPRLSRVTR